jgi:hypothetical protein
MPGADLVGRSGPAHVDGELGGIVRRLPGEELDLVYRSARGHLYGLLRCRIRNTRASGPPMAGAGRGSGAVRLGLHVDVAAGFSHVLGLVARDNDRER